MAIDFTAILYWPASIDAQFTAGVVSVLCCGAATSPGHAHDDDDGGGDDHGWKDITAALVIHSWQMDTARCGAHSHYKHVMATARSCLAPWSPRQALRPCLPYLYYKIIKIIFIYN